MKKCLLGLIKDDEILNYLKKHNTAENRKLLLTTDKLRYLFCSTIQDRDEIWDQITDQYWFYYYCLKHKSEGKLQKEMSHNGRVLWYHRDVKEHIKIRNRITDPEWAYTYCRDIKDSTKIRNRITNPDWAFVYCKNIKDRPKIRRYITDEELLAELDKG